MLRLDLEECNSTYEKVYCLDQEGALRMSEAYLQTGWTFATELFCENSKSFVRLYSI